MAGYYEDYVDRLADLHNDCKKVLEALPQRAIDWSPKSGLNPIGVLVVHIVGAELYWIGDVVMSEPSGRQRDKEFITRDVPSHELARRLDDSLVYIERSLKSLGLSSLEEERVSPRDGQIVTVGWSLLHVLKHTGLHLGHMEVMRHLWLNSKT